MTIIRTILLIIIFASCSNNIDDKKLIGRYVMATDTIELLPNKTFRHILIGNTNYGTWELNSAANEVAFYNFKFIDELAPGVWYSRITVTNGEIQLNVNSDISDGYFTKISDK
jgi:hypothetical protein